MSVNVPTKINDLYEDSFGFNNLTFDFANNQSTPADVTGFKLDPAVVKEFIVDCVVVRHFNNGTEYEDVRHFTLKGFYKNSTGVWHIGEGTSIGDEVGIDLTMTNDGQLQYTSTYYDGVAINNYIKFIDRD